MQNDKFVSDHYTHGSLLAAIESAITQMGKTLDSISIDDLAPVDEFHIGGRLATDNLLSQCNFTEQHHLLDVGCGLGGASRYVATKHNSRVTGIDLTQEFIETGNTLCSWVGLEKSVNLQQGSALDMPFEDDGFDGGYMLHVGMNIDDKEGLFKEIYRVLRKGATFAVYDVMRQDEGELIYPVPWAAEVSTSSLSNPEQYKQALTKAGFDVCVECNRREFALDFFKQLREKLQASGGPPPLGLHTLMQESTAIKLKNMVDNITAGLIAPVEIIARKP